MILIDKVRIENFRSLKEFEIDLGRLTILAGMNNSGKTTLLRSLNLLFGAKKFQPTRDDLFIDSSGNQPSNSFCIDARIIPVDENDTREETFRSQWLNVFGNEIKVDEFGEFFAIRYKVIFSGRGDKYKTILYTISDWENCNLTDEDILGITIGESISLYYIDAQRDLSHDVQLRHSYFGKLASQVNDSFDSESAQKIIEEIEKLNGTAIENSEVLSHLQERLKELNKTANDSNSGVSISPFSTSVRELHKGMKVNFKDGESDKFSLEYHGMGTRSWASLLSFKAFISWEIISKEQQGEAYYPILALEEPEAHLHPNAQRTLYDQLKEIGGQKIISTHSPYVASQASLDQLRHMHKPSDYCIVNRLEFSDDDEAEIKRLLDEIDTEGNTEEINRKNRPIIKQLKAAKRKKLNKDDRRRIEREIMNTKGELLFSKVFILFEGETEEQALPLFAKEYFQGKSAFDYGINFIGVGGKSNYGPFLNLARYLKIPFYILSDGDGDTENEVKSMVNSIFDDHTDKVFVLDDCDFEEYLIGQDYRKQLIKAINSCRGANYFPTEYCKEQHGQKRKGGEIKDYLLENGDVNPDNMDQALLDCLYSGKTEFASYIATEITSKKDEEGNCRLPQKVIELLAAVKQELSI